MKPYTRELHQKRKVTVVASRIVYICEICFRASDTPDTCCGGHRMVRCDAGEPGSERSRPLYDDEGRLLTHAPRWWLERHQEATQG
ncbi:MAG: hypothetical protein M3220_07540 [Chloroflexota bacterium]|nr:hypothetical protein [Chloroflexota bacterium]